MTGRSCSRSTAATGRPTSRSSSPTAKCSRSSAGRRARRTTSALEGSLTCSRSCSPTRAGRGRAHRTATDRSPTSRSCSLAGVDFPAEERRMLHALRPRRRLAGRISVGNDTFAVLRAGTERGLGRRRRLRRRHQLRRRRAGRPARSLPCARPRCTGDWGGGYDVGLAAVFAAARSEDGRGDATTLEQAVPAHFGVRDTVPLAEALHRGPGPSSAGSTSSRPLVFAACRDATPSPPRSSSAWPTRSSR